MQGKSGQNKKQRKTWENHSKLRNMGIVMGRWHGLASLAWGLRRHARSDWGEAGPWTKSCQFLERNGTMNMPDMVGHRETRQKVCRLSTCLCAARAAWGIFPVESVSLRWTGQARLNERCCELSSLIFMQIHAAFQSRTMLPCCRLPLKATEPPLMWKQNLRQRLRRVCVVQCFGWLGLIFSRVVVLMQQWFSLWICTQNLLPCIDLGRGFKLWSESLRLWLPDSLFPYLLSLQHSLRPPHWQSWVRSVSCFPWLWLIQLLGRGISWWAKASSRRHSSLGGGAKLSTSASSWILTCDAFFVSVGLSPFYRFEHDHGPS